LLKDTTLYIGITHTSCKISASICLVPRGELSPIKGEFLAHTWDCVLAAKTYSTSQAPRQVIAMISGRGKSIYKKKYPPQCQSVHHNYSRSTLGWNPVFRVQYFTFLIMVWQVCTNISILLTVCC